MKKLLSILAILVICLAFAANALLFASEMGGGETGSGDITGPASSTDNAIARFHSTTGKILQNGLATVDDDGTIRAPGAVFSGPVSMTAALFTPVDLGNSGASTTVDFNAGSRQKITLTGSPDCAVTFTPPTGSKASNITIVLIQGAGGNKTITWSSLPYWASGVAMTLSTAAGARDVVSCYYDGADYYCQGGAFSRP